VIHFSYTSLQLQLPVHVCCANFHPTPVSISLGVDLAKSTLASLIIRLLALDSENSLADEACQLSFYATVLLSSNRVYCDACFDQRSLFTLFTHSYKMFFSSMTCRDCITKDVRNLIGMSIEPPAQYKVYKNGSYMSSLLRFLGE
jgi:hypothetical protein